jgi:hypothetical protein
MRSVFVPVVFFLAFGFCNAEPVRILIKLEPDTSSDAIQKLKSKIDVSESQEIESMQSEIWTSHIDQKSANQVLSESTIVNRYDILKSDYRHLFTPVPNGMKLPSDVDRRRQILTKEPAFESYAVVQFTAPAFWDLYIKNGFDKSEDFMSRGSVLIDLLGQELLAIRRKVAEYEKSSNILYWSADLYTRSDATGQYLSAGSVNLTLSRESAIGRFELKTALFTIKDLGDGYFLLARINLGKLRYKHPIPKDIEGLKDIMLFRKLKFRGDSRPKRGSICDGNSEPIITLGFAFTNAALALVPEPTVFIASRILDAKTSFEENSVPVSVQQAGTDFAVVNYDESESTCIVDLEQLISGGTSGFVQVHTWRAAKEADIVMLVNASTDCPGYTDPIGATAETAFSLLKYSTTVEMLSFEHELGHIFGARHEAATDPIATPFAWGHGFRSVDWMTIMAISCTGPAANCARQRLWSHPPSMGSTELEDVRRVLIERAPVVGGFQP